MGHTALGIDIGSHSVKAVLLRRRGGKIQVLRAGRANLEELEHLEDSRRKQTKVAMIVRNLLRSMGIRSHPAHTAVAGRKSIIRYTRVPPAPAWRLKMLIDYEIQGDTEGGGRDLAYDFRLLDLPTSHLEFTVMIAMARNELVESHFEILHEAGVDVENVTLAPFPLFNTFVHNRGPAVENDRTTLLVDVGSENLNVVVQRNGRLFFARNISPAGRAFTEAVRDEFRLPFDEAEKLKCSKGRLLVGGEARADDETVASLSADAPTEITGEDEIPLMAGDLGTNLPVAETDEVPRLSDAMVPVAGRLASAIQSSLMYCRAQTRMTDLEVDEMVLTGGGARLPGLRQALSRRLGIPAAPADPLKGLDLTPLKRPMRDDLETHAECYATAIGLALPRLKPDVPEFSLLPRKIKERRHFLRRTLYLWLATAAMVALMLLLGVSSVQNTRRLENRVNALETQFAANDDAKRRIVNLGLVNTEYAEEIRLLKDRWESPRRLLAVFDALTRHMGEVPEAILTSVRVAPLPARDRKKTYDLPTIVVNIKGYVLRRVKDRSGLERQLKEQEYHEVVRRLSTRLEEDPVFGPPPAQGSSVVKKLTADTGESRLATFELELTLARDQNDPSLGRE